MTYKPTRKTLKYYDVANGDMLICIHTRSIVTVISLEESIMMDDGSRAVFANLMDMTDFYVYTVNERGLALYEKLCDADVSFD